MAIIQSLEAQWQQLQGTQAAEDFDPSKPLFSLAM